jgi:hypothetical protein
MDQGEVTNWMEVARHSWYQDLKSIAQHGKDADTAGEMERAAVVGVVTVMMLFECQAWN